MPTRTEMRQRLLTLDMKFQGGMPTDLTELQEIVSLCEALGFERARAHYASVVASVVKTPDQEWPNFTISVVLYTRNGPYLQPETLDIRHANGFLGHDRLLKELTERWRDWPDIKIVGPGHIVYKDIEENLIQ